MTQRGFILMYHRLCEPSADARPWFERGMAVSPHAWRAQLAWLAPRVQFVTLRELWKNLDAPSARPCCAVTFDDGFQDIREASQAGIPLTIFPVAHSARHEALLPADHYYSLLTRAQNRAPSAAQLRAHGFELAEDPPAIDQDWRWWVRGPIKAAIVDAPPSSWGERLDALASALRSRPAQASELYLGLDDLRRLLAQGHEIGGHGSTHQHLDLISGAELAQELSEAQRLLDELGAPSPRSFCYPNGRFHQACLDALPQAGFDLACTVREAAVTSCDSPLQLPRVFMKDVLPHSHAWPKVLEALT
jgi:peptidoglycan/xylan/chitin deacetylase (PgdA/CDA1 family)